MLDLNASLLALFDASESQYSLAVLLSPENKLPPVMGLGMACLAPLGGEKILRSNCPSLYM